MKKLVVGFILGSTLSLAGSALAEQAKQFILTKVEYPIFLKGTEYKNDALPALNYDGNTYVPLKAVGDLLGTFVQWNDRAKRVEIGSTTALPSSSAPVTYQYAGNFSLIISNSDGLFSTDRDLYLYKDSDGKLYTDVSSFFTFGLLVPIGLNDYTVEPSTNPLLKGELFVEYPLNYISNKSLFASPTAPYFEMNFHTPDYKISYEISTEKGKEKGIIVEQMEGRRMLLLSLDDINTRFGFNISYQLDEEKKIATLSF